MTKIAVIVLAAAILLSGCAIKQAEPVSPPPTPEYTTVPAPTPEPTPEPTPTPTPEPTPEPTPIPDAAEIALAVSVDSGGADTGLTDGDNATVRWVAEGSTLWFRAEEPMSSLYLRWENLPGVYKVNWEGGSIVCGKYGYLHEYIELPQSVSEVSITAPAGDYLVLSDARSFTEGEPPRDVQIWSPPADTADILAIPTHADDELLFFGPALAYYIQEKGQTVQIAYMTHHWRQAPRPHELLDGLWTLGVRNYPIISEWADKWAGSLAAAKTIYDAESVIRWQVELIRRFRPMIIIGHDLNGEYGHGAHILNADCLVQAVELAADAANYAESADKYGAWDTPKLYLHLYEGGQIVFPVDEPMENAGGITPFRAAEMAYDFHKSQHIWFKLQRGELPTNDCRIFGLYRSTVGADTGTDFMENLPDRSKGIS